MDIDRTTTQPTTNAFEGGTVLPTNQFDGLGELPSLVGGELNPLLTVPVGPPRPSKKVRREEKQQAFYQKHFQQWGTDFAQQYLQNLLSPNLGHFYDTSSMLTFVQGGNVANLSSAETIYAHFQMFQSLKEFHVDVLQVQPCVDYRSIFVSLTGRLVPREGAECGFHTTMNLSKGPAMKQIGEYKTPNYINNQSFVLM